MKVSPHFTALELTRSDYALRHGIPNDPPASARANLRRLCLEILEPLREWARMPVVISSGYRCPIVNDAIGSTPLSAHIDGRAADLTVPGLPLLEVFDQIIRADWPVDQVILEHSSWVHVAIARDGAKPRRQALVKEHGRPYTLFNPNP